MSLLFTNCILSLFLHKNGLNSQMIFNPTFWQTFSFCKPSPSINRETMNSTQIGVFGVKKSCTSCPNLVEWGVGEVIRAMPERKLFLWGVPLCLQKFLYYVYHERVHGSRPLNKGGVLAATLSSLLVRKLTKKLVKSKTFHNRGFFHMNWSHASQWPAFCRFSL